MGLWLVSGRTTRRALPCGDYGLSTDGRLVAAVERKSLVDLVASPVGGKLRFAAKDLAALPRAAVVVEDRYPQVFRLAQKGVMTPTAIPYSPLPRTNDGQMIKGPILDLEERALTSCFFVAGLGFEPRTSGL